MLSKDYTKLAERYLCRVRIACDYKRRASCKYTVVGYTDVLEDDEEDSDSEPEGQDIDELYHFVKQTHQQETHSVQVDVQHPALTPVLRPYQREAVNWMLQQECFRSAPPDGKYTLFKERHSGQGESP